MTTAPQVARTMPADEPNHNPITGDAGLQTDVLEDLRSARNYRAWLCDLVRPWLGARPLEIGSGLGDYAEQWARSGQHVTASEADRARLARLRQRFADDERVAVRELLAPVTEVADYSAAVAINVLEHIRDDVGALRSFAGLVRPGGHVVVFVPAFPALYSAFDAGIGHERRYRRRTLTQAMTAAGLHVVAMRHVNSLGMFAWFLTVRLLGLAPKDGVLLTIFDRIVVPVLRRLEDRWAPPFGQSLLAVGRVPSPNQTAV